MLSGFQQKVAAERARRDSNNEFIVSTLINSGRVRDINDLAPFLGDIGSATGRGGKPRAGKGGGAGKAGAGGADPMALMGMLVNPILQKSYTQSQQKADIAGRGVGLMSEDEAQQRAEAAKQRELEAQTKSRIEIEQAKPARLQQKFVRYQGRDISANFDPATGKYYDTAGNELIGAIEKTQGRETGALAERTKQIAARLGIDPTSPRAQQLAALELDKERSVKQQQAATRLNTYLAMSRQQLLTNTERYNEMQQLFPYTLALKMAGLEVAQMRPDVIRQTLAKGDRALSQPTAADRDGIKEASKIVEAATRQAETLASKKSSILMGLGLEEDQDGIRRRLIEEMSGGQDPDAVEALAKARIVEPTTPTHKIGDIVKMKDGTYHKVLRVDSNGKLALDPTPVAAPAGQ